MQALKNIWHLMVRKKKYEWKEEDSEQWGIVEKQKYDGRKKILKIRKVWNMGASSKCFGRLQPFFICYERHWKNSKRRKDDEDEVEERDYTSKLKKPRVVWLVEFNQQFVTAVNQLGIDNMDLLRFSFLFFSHMFSFFLDCLFSFRSYAL